MAENHRAFLSGLFDAAVAAADPLNALGSNLPGAPRGRTVVVGAGKGAAQLAQALEGLWDGPLEGVVVTRYGYGAPCRSIRVMEAAHPVPDAAGLAAAAALKAAVSGLGPDDLVIALICGGGSALLPDPPPGLTLADLQALNTALLSSGAPISVMNAVRKRFSGINGGRLAALAGEARICNLIVSDVPGDAPGEVASGPTVPGRASAADVRALIEARGLSLPQACADHLREQGEDPAAPTGNIETRIIASAALSLEAAARKAREAGVTPWVLSDRIEGEAQEVALVHAALARQAASAGTPYPAPLVLLSGGETTVTLRHRGKGGRNSAFQLSLALALEGEPWFHALAADTDGIDGSEDNAGAWVDGSSVPRMRAAGLDPLGQLQRNDSYVAFRAVNDLFMTGPTGTNVNDFRAILITGAAR
ncbi:Putative hydroxypyruvate reductase [Sulfitobacter sp. THAF37]|uniref:glycerate kinase type-2 family protein n=1 Tax=Sulfitobacter sp. THAF37 TaxID=2587855 RepID=UPI001268D21C|nr:glycerate kinase [Sulfitobacter sp. THAF37]QFT58827.1 Putative hydroxypyruvate reductase [Sulfitobacter sp. THAF37]